MKNTGSSIVGQWRITSMEMWDADYINMEVPAYISVRDNMTGQFQFGLVQGDLDGCITLADGEVRIDFSWSGFDENDPICGRGWMQINGDHAEGRIFIHLGDDSGLTAVRQSTELIR